MRQTAASVAKQESLVACWREPEGTTVAVTLDDGSVWNTFTLSLPWMLCGVAVILLEGKSGGYRLDRCKVVRN